MCCLLPEAWNVLNDSNCRSVFSYLNFNSLKSYEKKQETCNYSWLDPGNGPLCGAQVCYLDYTGVKNTVTREVCRSAPLRGSWQCGINGSAGMRTCPSKAPATGCMLQSFSDLSPGHSCQSCFSCSFFACKQGWLRLADSLRNRAGTSGDLCGSHPV